MLLRQMHNSAGRLEHARLQQQPAKQCSVLRVPKRSAALLTITAAGNGAVQEVSYYTQSNVIQNKNHLSIGECLIALCAAKSKLAAVAAAETRTSAVLTLLKGTSTHTDAAHGIY